MKFIYDFFIILALIVCQPLRLLSSKINLSYKGRKKSFKILKKEVNPNEKNMKIQYVIKRDFTNKPFDLDKITAAIHKAMVVVGVGNEQMPKMLHCLFIRYY